MRFHEKEDKDFNEIFDHRSEAEKEFKKEVFRVCNSIKVLGNKYYHGELERIDFLQGFADRIFLIAHSFLIKDSDKK